jgi:hypothetical protein
MRTCFKEIQFARTPLQTCLTVSNDDGCDAMRGHQHKWPISVDRHQAHPISA